MSDRRIRELQRRAAQGDELARESLFQDLRRVYGEHHGDVFLRVGITEHGDPVDISGWSFDFRLRRGGIVSPPAFCLPFVPPADPLSGVVVVAIPAVVVDGLKGAGECYFDLVGNDPPHKVASGTLWFGPKGEVRDQSPGEFPC